MDVSSAFQVALAVLASLGGGGLLVFVLSSWLGKVWANRVLESDRRRYSEELERVHGELEKAVHVHRVQFETEFGALSEIWAKLSAVRATMGEVRPMTDIRDPDEDPDARFHVGFAGSRRRSTTLCAQSMIEAPSTQRISIKNFQLPFRLPGVRR